MNNQNYLKWIDPPGLFEYFGISINTQKSLRKRRLIPYSKIGSSIRYNPRDIDIWARMWRKENPNSKKIDLENDSGAKFRIFHGKR